MPAMPTATSRPHGLRARLQRGLILAAMAVTAINIWTGSPLLALWVGSRLQGTSGLKMGAVFAVVVVMGATGDALVKGRGALGGRHVGLLGVVPGPGGQQPGRG